MKKLEPFLPFVSLILAITLYTGLLIAFVKYELPSGEKADPPVHAVAAYISKWNLYISSCQELYFATSDHTAFNEGCRYSVLRGNVVVPSATRNRRGEQISKRTGNGFNEMIGNMLEDVCYILAIPKEQRYSMTECDWAMLSSDNGSRVLIVKNKAEDVVIVAEELR